jgi:hypothetical protein
MNYLSESYCNVGYFARLFALAWDKAQLRDCYGNPRLGYQEDLAVARKNLECSQAVYRVMRNGEVA